MCRLLWKCLERLDRQAKLIQHFEHLYGLISSCLPFIWSFKMSILLKGAAHMSQTNWSGFFVLSVQTFLCRSKADFLILKQNLLLHTLHLKGLILLLAFTATHIALY